MNVKNLNNKAIDEMLTAIFSAVKCNDPDFKREFLEALVENVLDPLSEDDFFGTEGWQHWAGVED